MKFIVDVRASSNCVVFFCYVLHTAYAILLLRNEVRF